MKKILIVCSKDWFLNSKHFIKFNKNKKIFCIKEKKKLNLQNLNKINPKFIFFPHWSYKVNKNIIKKFNCVCFHTAPLPYGRGGSPIQNLILKKFKKDNIIKINDNIAIIVEIDKKNILLFYKIINNSNINDLSKTFTLDNSQINNINIIANTIEDFNIYLKNTNLITDNRTQLDNTMISFLNNKKWFPIDFKYKFTIKNKLSDVFEYIFNNINLYTNLNINDINILNTTFTKEYKDSTILINNINIDKNTLPKNMLSNIRKNIKLKLLNNISIKNFKNLKLISLVQINNYNYEKYFQDYYNIYLIISKYKLNNIRLNKNICRDLLTDYKKQCSDIILVHLEDCNKEQLKHARIKRNQINTQIQLLEENR